MQHGLHARVCTHTTHGSHRARLRSREGSWSPVATGPGCQEEQPTWTTSSSNNANSSPARRDGMAAAGASSAGPYPFRDSASFTYGLVVSQSSSPSIFSLLQPGPASWAQQTFGAAPHQAVKTPTSSSDPSSSGPWSSRRRHTEAGGCWCRPNNGGGVAMWPPARPSRWLRASTARSWACGRPARNLDAYATAEQILDLLQLVDAGQGKTMVMASRPEPQSATRQLQLDKGQLAGAETRAAA